MLSRRRFLGHSATGAIVAAIPIIAIPKAKEAVAAVESRIEKRRRAIRGREIEGLYSDKFATELRPSSMNIAVLVKEDSHSRRVGIIWVEKNLKIEVMENTCTLVFRLYSSIVGLGLSPFTDPPQNDISSLRDVLEAGLALRDIQVRKYGYNWID